MAYPLGLTVKSMAGIAGAFSATTGGVLLFNIGGNSVPEKIIEKFEKRVEKVIWDLGVDKDWCKKSEKENKYVCDKNKSGENLKKIVFASRHNTVDKYSVEGNPSSVEIEIVDSRDFDTFPEGVKFVIVKSNSNQIKIKRTTDNQKPKWSLTQIDIWAKGGELKVLNGKMFWAWEEVNDLAWKIGLNCKENEGKKCPFDETKNAKVNVMDGNKKVEGVTIKSEKLIFDRSKPNCFQGYSFTANEDIQLLRNGKTIKGPITKLENGKQYQIVRDSKNETKWYLTKVGK